MNNDPWKKRILSHNKRGIKMKRKTELWIQKRMTDCGWTYEAALKHYIYYKCTHGELVQMYIELHRDSSLEVEV